MTERPNLHCVEGTAALPLPVEFLDPLAYQSACVASQVARGFSSTTIDNGTGVLERFLSLAAKPAWELTEVIAPILAGVRRPGPGRPPKTHTRIDRDYENLRAGMRTLFHDLAIDTPRHRQQLVDPYAQAPSQLLRES